jgi:predicted amidohydrolase
MTKTAKVRSGAVLSNASVLVGQKRPTGIQRKIHSPGNEIRLFGKGDPWSPFETDLGRIDMLFCDDMSFPNTSRELVLQGAEILVSLGACSKGGETPELALYSRGEIPEARTLTFIGLNLTKYRMPATYRTIADGSIYYPPIDITTES